MSFMGPDGDRMEQSSVRPPADSLLKESTTNADPEAIRVCVESTLSSFQGKQIIEVLSSDRVELIIEKFMKKFETPSSHAFILRDLNGLIVKNKSTVDKAKINDGDNLYLSTTESERALFSYTNWWHIALLCTLFSIGIICGGVGLYMSGRPAPYVYKIIIDAGSVHTSVYTYRFSGEKEKGTGIIEEASFCEMGQTGISSFFGNPSAVRKYINSSCLRDAAADVEEDEGVVAPLYLGGTAGMRTLRILDTDGAGWIMGNLTRELRGITDNSNAQAEIVNGETEGLNGWVTANYLQNVFGDFVDKDDIFHASEEEGVEDGLLLGRSSAPETYGALDWGGASAQRTVQVPVSEANKNVTLYGSTYHISTMSHLCYGQKEALYRHRALLVFEAYLNKNKTFPFKVIDPCAPSGSRVEHKIRDLFMSPCTQILDSQFMRHLFELKGKLIFTGSGKTEQCAARSAAQFDYQLCTSRFEQYSTDTVCMDAASISPPPPMRFNAFSTYWYLITALGLPEHHSLDRFEEAVDSLCTKSRDELLSAGFSKLVVDSACFKANFMKTLLTKGYHFNHETYGKIKFVKRLGSAEVGWTLGHMILASNSIPALPARIYISPTMFYMLLKLGAGFALLSLFFAYQARKVASASRKYQRFGHL